MRRKWDRAMDIAAWIGYAIFAAYLLLKAAGVLHSPPLADIIAAGGILVFIGRYLQKIDHLHLDMSAVKVDVRHMESDIRSIDTRLAGVEARL